MARLLQETRAARAFSKTEKEEFYLVFGDQPTGAYLATLDGTILAANSALVALLGFSSVKELRSSSLRKQRSLPRFTWEEFRRRIARERELRGIESVWRRKTGPALMARENVWLVPGPQGSPLYYEGIVLDRTGSQATEALRVFRTVFESVPVGLVQIDPMGRLLENNRTFQAMLGYSDLELQKLSYKEIIQSQDEPYASRRFQQIVQGQGDFTKAEVRYRRRDASTLWVQETLSVLHDSAGLPRSMIAVVEDITTRKKVERAVEESDQRFAKAFWASPLPMSITRLADGGVIEANSSFLSMLGFEREELIGRTLVELGVWAEHDDRDRFTRLITEKQPIRDVEILFRRKSGDVGVALANAEIIELGGERVLLTISNDVTIQKRAETEREALIDRLQELDTAKTQFINMAAHELRTPLAPMRAELHLLKMARAVELGKDQRESVNLLDRNMARMSHLVEDLLEVARMQSGRLSLEKGRVRLDRLVSQAASSFRAVARKGKISFRVRLRQNVFVEGDPKRLEEVVYNLLSNAIKFTPPGGRVLAELKARNGSTSFAVHDSGIGIKPADIPKLFQSFSRVHDPKQKVQAGTGLGLFISRGIVELHGGRIWCESAGLNRGCTFTFELPRLPTKNGARRKNVR